MTCPICRRRTDPAFRPFCSRRCADVDLARWFSGAYAVPSHSEEEDEALEEALREARRDGPEDKTH